MIETIFEELKEKGLVTSCNEFSRKWLGMDESYMRGLRAKGRRPSARVLAQCAVRLRDMAEALSKGPSPMAREKARHVNLLADKCFAEIVQSARATT